jgi:hypothetical protein
MPSMLSKSTCLICLVPASRAALAVAHVNDAKATPSAIPNGTS